MTRLINLLTLAALVVGCGSLNRKEPSKERDVPTSARKGYEAQPRRRVLVLPFLDSASSRSNKVSEEARKILIRDLAKADRFVFVAPADFPKDVNSFIVNGEYDLITMAKIAETLGVAAIIEGKLLDIKVKKMGDEVGIVRRFKAKMEAVVRLRMYAVRNAKEILNEARSATVEGNTTRIAETSPGTSFLEEDPQLVGEAVTQAYRSMVTPIIRSVDKLGWEGRVALIQGNRIYVNAGRLSGLQVGDILKVSDQGDEVFDPETGDSLGVAPGRMKGTLELVSYFGQDGAITVVHSGSGFKENDLVELY
jgi:curli biogenesis system outer membrane secretion channel CsgG